MDNNYIGMAIAAILFFGAGVILSKLSRVGGIVAIFRKIKKHFKKA